MIRITIPNSSVTTLCHRKPLSFFHHLLPAAIFSTSPPCQDSSSRSCRSRRPTAASQMLHENQSISNSSPALPLPVSLWCTTPSRPTRPSLIMKQLSIHTWTNTNPLRPGISYFHGKITRSQKKRARRMLFLRLPCRPKLSSLRRSLNNNTTKPDLRPDMTFQIGAGNAPGMSAWPTTLPGTSEHVPKKISKHDREITYNNSYQISGHRWL